MLCILSSIVFTVAIMQGQTDQAAPKDRNPVLVELFTSEGCSSCPPADALLQKMDTSQPVAGAQLIVLSEHVDYWDHDGWKDPYSSSSITDRQNDYVQALGLKTAFTPQFVVDGTHQFSMGNGAEAREAFQSAVSARKVPITIESPVIDTHDPQTVKARILIDGKGESHNAEVYVALALDHTESQVLRGENTGKHLTHVAVAEQLKKIGKLEKGKEFQQDLNLKLKSNADSRNLRLIVFVQESGPGRVVGSAMQKVAD